MEILSLVKVTRGLSKRPSKEEYEQWKIDITAKREIKRRSRPESRNSVRPKTPEEKEIAKQAEDSRKEEMEEELELLKDKVKFVSVCKQQQTKMRSMKKLLLKNMVGYQVRGPNE